MDNLQYDKSIKRVSDSYLCTNCGACQVICPKDAIDFVSTSIGRIYADVSNKCINCGLCQKVCPSLNDTLTAKDADNELLGHISSLRVGKALDKEIFYNSQSGGACTALLKFLFDTKKIDGALVCRMDYGKDVPEVKPILIESADELFQSQKSKYAPVPTLGVLKNKIKEFSSLAIVGIGCQIEGLVGLEEFAKDFKGKILCRLGLICEKTLCSTIQDVYVSFLPSPSPKKIIWKCKYATFLNPQHQYQSAPLVVEDEQGYHITMPNSVRFILKDMFTAPRCRICRDKLNLNADIVLGDPWQMSNIDWVNGESLVIGRTERGESIIEEAISAKYIQLSPRPIEELVKGQTILQRRKQVQKYSAAYGCLKPTIDSFLLKPELVENDNPTEKEVQSAKKDLLDFQVSERLSKEEIIKNALKKIKSDKLKRTLIYRAIRKIVRIILRK
ncbi:MAG: Coenzyme F420 hydrogenase/dehydrogenase, beta subunit C-terminal domain [Muribaculaceae bacterium]|nr:Coenzyme F420 hydrogenase/dehydrogenase, beta subunit C-terminal domain [Muribaculaceae bacterium]